jgi:hexosaminidase
MKVLDGTFELNGDTTLSVDPAFADSALEKMIRLQLGTATGFTLKNAPAETAGIIFKKISDQPKLGSEGYRLRVDADRIVVEAPTAAGAFYALQTVRQLLPPEIFEETAVDGVKWIMPRVEIVDYPRFQWRGMHMDVSRHFFGPEYVKHFIDLLALHKFNSFHWHLCDDDGWRLEIKRYPELTAKGSSLCRGGSYEKPMFYTQKQVKEIVRYASERHVSIVPEIEIPGHEKAAIEVYPEWGARNKDKLGNVFNIRDSTVEALKNILGEVVELFPGPYVHCGGDEVWASWVWSKDPESKAKAKRLGLNGARQIQNWLMNEMALYLKSKGRRMVGWGEISNDKLDSDVVVMAWRGDGKTGVAAAMKGRDIVMAPGDYTYFDHRQAPKEKGFGGGVLAMDRVYSFDPADPKRLPGEAVKRVLGCQGQLWSELICDDARMDYMAYPRATALAEVAWTPQKTRSYGDFLKRLPAHLKRLDVLGVKYRFPVDLSFEERDGAVAIVSNMFGGKIRYTTDGSDPTVDSPVYSAPIPMEGLGKLRAAMFRPNGLRGPVAEYVGVTKPPLLADSCVRRGGFRVEELVRGEKNIGCWRGAKWSLLWKVRFAEAGRYKVSGVFAGLVPAGMKLTIDGKTLKFKVPASGGWAKPRKVEIGEALIDSSGIHQVILSVDSPKKGFKGLNVWRINFEK